MRSTFALICLLCLTAQVGCAQPQPPAMINPVGTGTPDPTVDPTLDGLDQAGKTLKDFSADVTLTEMDAVTADETSRVGQVWFQNKADGSARIHVIFTSKKLVNRTLNEKVEYVLDGGILLDRNYALKQEVQRQVVKPGEKINPLKLGEGPFPLPLGQSKDEVHRLFDVKCIAAAKDDPAGSIHLQLTPRKGTRYARKVKTMDIWVDPKTNMPVRIQTMDVNETTVRTTNLSNVKLNAGIADKDFAVEPIGKDWSQRIEQLAD